MRPTACSSRSRPRSPDSFNIPRTQAANEDHLWWSLAPEDKAFFAPVLAAGLSDGGRFAYVVQPYIEFDAEYEDLDSGAFGIDFDDVVAMPAWVQAASDHLVETYDLGSDWGARQMKPVGDSFLVHDYGYNGDRTGSMLSYSPVARVYAEA
jgi:hypothetical protein